VGKNQISKKRDEAQHVFPWGNLNRETMTKAVKGGRRTAAFEKKRKKRKKTFSRPGRRKGLS